MLATGTGRAPGRSSLKGRIRSGLKQTLANDRGPLAKHSPPFWDSDGWHMPLAPTVSGNRSSCLSELERPPVPVSA